ncbi:MAG: pyridoxal-phosphate dependent enzyme [Candidatus Eisenbacteria bacterium]
MGRFQWVCTRCGRRHAPERVDYLCPACAPEPAAVPGALSSLGLPGVLRAEYETAGGFPRDDLGARYLDLLPIDEAGAFPPLPVGPSPLLAPARLRSRLGLGRLFLKNDTALPTASLKDRASSLVVARAREKGVALITTASTGNAATSLAGMCAAAGLHAVILVPAAAPREKLAQMIHYGATVCPIEGSYDQAFALCLRAGARFGWYNRSTAFNPYTIEGKKTVAFEIWEQLGRTAPDVVVVPVGDGAILAGVEKGFSDLLRFKRIDRLPRLMAVQAEGSAAIVRAWESGTERVGDAMGNGPQGDAPADHAPAAPAADDSVAAGPCATIADSICVGTPANGAWAVEALRRTGGRGVRVSDAEILSAMPLLASHTGVYAEPAAAAPLAGLMRLMRERPEELNTEATIVLLITGSGLKDTASALRAVSVPPALPLDVDLLGARVAGRD